MATSLSSPELALVALGQALHAEGYRFVTVTPETHRRVNARPGADRARTLADVFGWSRPFDRALLPAHHVELLRAAGALAERGGMWASRVRFSTLGGRLYVHSAHPTTEEDAVFFGPDTYRFCAALDREIDGARRVVDVGAGSGAGGLSLAGRVDQVVLADVNDAALSYARVNAALTGCEAEIVRSDVLADVRGELDLVISNPPYLVDPRGRAYRDGGAGQGTALGVRIVDEAMARLSSGGRLLLYTGAPVEGGVDLFLRAVEPVLARARDWRYAELDPDVFGEELDTPAYAEIERIAVVVLSATRG